MLPCHHFFVRSVEVTDYYALAIEPSLARVAGRFTEMGRDRDGSPPENGKDMLEDREHKRKASPENSGGGGGTGSGEEDVKRRETRRRTRDDEVSGSGSGSGLGSDNESESEEEERRRSRKARRKRKSRKRRSRADDDDSVSGSESDSDSESESESDYSSDYSDSDESEREEERRRRKRKERKRREKEERERKRRKREKEKKRRRREKEEERDRKRKKKEKRKKKKSEKGKKGAVTNSWGKYGIIRETDMWNKRPEFTAWLAEIKQVNLESLPPWEEKKMFKEFMEDHNTATFPSKKYYDIDAYYRRKMEKERNEGFKKVVESERTVFNDEEQRRIELQQAREKQKEEQVLALKQSMEGGMAQAMREQARLKEEMAYLYKIGNIEAAAAIQKRLDPDVAM